MPENLDDAKGNAKKKLGAATGNEKLENEGKADQAGAKIKDAVDSVKDKLTGKG